MAEFLCAPTILSRSINPGQIKKYFISTSSICQTGLNPFFGNPLMAQMKQTEGLLTPLARA